jgi:hypothetical protein
MRYHFNFRDVWAQWDFIASGVVVTIVITVVTVLAGSAVGDNARHPTADVGDENGGPHRVETRAPSAAAKPPQLQKRLGGWIEPPHTLP